MVCNDQLYSKYLSFLFYYNFFRDNYDRPPTAASKRDSKASNGPKRKMNGPREFKKDKKVKQRRHERK